MIENLIKVRNKKTSEIKFFDSAVYVRFFLRENKDWRVIRL